MLEITDNAMDILHRSTLVLAPDPDSGKCIRLQPGRDAGVALTFEEPKNSDTTHCRDDRVVLAVPQKIDMMCSGQVLDMDADGRLSIE